MGGHAVTFADSGSVRWRRHPLFALAGLRPVVSEHTRAEDALLRRYAPGRQTIVELGVSEGASSLSLRESMSANATLWLVDPYSPGRIPGLNVSSIVARRLVNSAKNGRVHWVRQLSWDAARNWSGPRVELLFSDGDHSPAAARRDWEAWSPLISTLGVVIFHDARKSRGGWVTEGYGPLQLVDQLFRQRKIPGWEIVDEVDSIVAVRRASP